MLLTGRSGITTASPPTAGRSLGSRSWIPSARTVGRRINIRNVEPIQLSKPLLHLRSAYQDNQHAKTNKKKNTDWYQELCPA